MCPIPIPNWTPCMGKQRNEKELLTQRSTLFVYLKVYPHRVSSSSIAWLNDPLRHIEIFELKKQDIIMVGGLNRRKNIVQEV